MCKQMRQTEHGSQSDRGMAFGKSWQLCPAARARGSAAPGSRAALPVPASGGKAAPAQQGNKTSARGYKSPESCDSPPRRNGKS